MCAFWGLNNCGTRQNRNFCLQHATRKKTSVFLPSAAILTCCVRHAYWFNNGMALVGWLTTFWLDLRSVCSTGGPFHPWYYNPDQIPVVEEVIGHRIGPSAVMLLSGQAIKLLFNHYVSIYRPGLLTTLVREALFCSGWQSMRGSQLVIVQRKRERLLSPKYDSYINTKEMGMSYG